ncbi:MAG: DUF1294 domain-containing protein [Chloroflexia bacterium]|nr:DUF1294 domain-containing protein [Chloroflexia bacterium]
MNFSPGGGYNSHRYRNAPVIITQRRNGTQGARPSVKTFTPLRLALLASNLFLLAVGGASWLGFLPLWIVLAYLLLSGFTALVYRFDKLQAVQGQWRVPKAMLHMLDALDGWPGALIAQL